MKVFFFLQWEHNWVITYSFLKAIIWSCFLSLFTFSSSCLLWKLININILLFSSLLLHSFSIVKIHSIVLAQKNCQWKDLVNNIWRVLQIKPGKHITVRQVEVRWVFTLAWCQHFRSMVFFNTGGFHFSFHQEILNLHWNLQGKHEVLILFLKAGDCVKCWYWTERVTIAKSNTIGLSSAWYSVIGFPLFIHVKI